MPYSSPAGGVKLHYVLVFSLSPGGRIYVSSYECLNIYELGPSENCSVEMAFCSDPLDSTYLVKSLLDTVLIVHIVEN